MAELPLPGLVPDFVSSAMATFGLYTIVEGCRIRFDRLGTHRYHATLLSDFKSIEELANFIANPLTWKNLGIGHGNSFPWFQNINITQQEYPEFYKTFPLLLSGLATDSVLQWKEDQKDKTKKGDLKKKLKKEGKEIPPELNKVNGTMATVKTPFYCLLRKATLGTIIKETLPLRKEAVANTLRSQATWVWSYGNQTVGLFPSYEGGTGFRTDVDSSSGGVLKFKRIVPTLMLMAIASWRLFPVFPSGYRVLVPGFHEEAFYYPIFSRPLDVVGFRTLMTNKRLSNFKRCRQGFRQMGVEAVFCTTKYSNGKDEDPYFNYPIYL